VTTRVSGSQSLFGSVISYLYSNASNKDQLLILMVFIYSYPNLYIGEYVKEQY
jgi:hypothetical protein